MKDLTPLMKEFLKDVPEFKPHGMTFEEAAKAGSERSASDFVRYRFEEELQKAKDAVQPDRAKQGPVFQVGEVLDIRGGKFQVTKIEPGHLRLKSLPSYLATPK